MIAFAAIEWIWGEAILNESWRDVVAIGGLLVTVIGFGVAIWQLRKTQSAARAAEIAANKALEESRLAYYKFIVGLSHRYIHEVRIHVDHAGWERSMVRLNDLIEQVTQLTSLDETWKELVDELHEWSIVCSRLKSGELKRFPKKLKWLDFCQRLETKLGGLLGPFSVT